MKNKGIVKEISENSIKVEVFKDSACSGCSSCSDKLQCSKTFFYEAKDLKIGDIVEFSVKDSYILKISLILYISPVILMMSCYFFSSKFGFSENLSIISSFMGLGIGFILVYIFDKIKKDSILKSIKITKENTYLSK